MTLNVYSSVIAFHLYFLQKTVFGGEPCKPDYSNIPCAVFRYNYLISFLFIFFCVAPPFVSEVGVEDIDNSLTKVKRLV